MHGPIEVFLCPEELSESSTDSSMETEPSSDADGPPQALDEVDGPAPVPASSHRASYPHHAEPAAKREHTIEQSVVSLSHKHFVQHLAIKHEPMVEHKGPVVGQQALVAGQQALMAGQQALMVGHQAPLAGHQAPLAGHQAPLAGHRVPLAGQQVLMKQETMSEGCASSEGCTGEEWHKNLTQVLSTRRKTEQLYNMQYSCLIITRDESFPPF